MRKTAQPYSGCFFIRAYSSTSRRPGFFRIESGIPTLPMSWRSAATSRFLEFWFFEAKLLPHAHAPFRQASAVHSGIEVFQIQQLVKSADHRAAQGRKLLLDLLDAQRIRCPVKNRVHDEHRSWAGRHSNYQHNRRHEPDVELELFAHAEMA